MSLRWRGKYYHLQLFFPGAKFPTRKEVEAQVHKVYPDAVVMVHYSSESNPNQPLIRVAEGNLIHGDYGNYIDGQKLPKDKEKKLVDVPYESLAHNASKEEFQLSGNTLNEENKYYKGNPKGTPKKPKAGDRRPGVTCEDKSFVEFMKRIEHLPDVTKEAIKNCGDDPLVAKAALEISGLPK